jgi:hypothetical protein
VTGTAVLFLLRVVVAVGSHCWKAFLFCFLVSFFFKYFQTNSLSGDGNGVTAMVVCRLAIGCFVVVNSGGATVALTVGGVTTVT